MPKHPKSDGYTFDDCSSIPWIADIQAIVENEPRRILSFANRFFCDSKIPADFRIEIAIRLNGIFRNIPQSSSTNSDQSRLWSGLLKMAIHDGDSINLRLYDEAKRTLLEVGMNSPESEAIKNFLDDYCCFHRNVPDLLERDFSNTDESQLYVWFSIISRYCHPVTLAETIKRLEQFLSHESYLIRTSVANGFSHLLTNQDLKNSDLQPYHSNFKSALKRLENDPNPYVNQAVCATIEMVEEVFDDFQSKDSPRKNEPNS